MAGPVRIAVLADVADATAGLADVGDSATRAAADLHAAGSTAAEAGSRLDTAGSHASTAAGGFGDLGAALALVPGPIGAIGSGMEAVAAPLQGITGAADLLTVAQTALKGSFVATAAASAKNAVSMVASNVATFATGVAAKAAAAGQWLLNAAMAANPIGLIVIAVIALVAVFVLLWRNSETFRRIVTGAWEGIKVAAVAVFDFLRGYLTFVFNAYKLVISTAIDAIKGYFGFIFGLPERLLGIGKAIMKGLSDGIEAGLDWVKSKIKGLASFIPDWLKQTLGIKSPSKIMAGLGKNVVAGLTAGIDGQLPALARTMRGVSGTITGLSADTSVTLAGANQLVTTGATGAAANTYAISVHVPVSADPAEVGRQVVSSIEAHERRIGRKRLAT